MLLSKEFIKKNSKIVTIMISLKTFNDEIKISQGFMEVTFYDIVSNFSNMYKFEDIF